MCVSRIWVLGLTPLCLATEHSPCSHSSGLSGLETQQLYCVCVCVLVCGLVWTCALVSSVDVCVLGDVAEGVSKDWMSAELLTS